MRTAIALLTLTTLAAACAREQPAPVADLCSRLAAAVDEHAAALAVSPDDAAVLTGERLIRLYDAGCGYGSD